MSEARRPPRRADRRGDAALQLLEQPRTQAGDAFVDHVDADALEVFQSDLDRRKVEVVDRAVLERREAVRRPMPVALHGDRDDRAAGEPRSLELRERLLPREQAADAR